MPVYDYKEKNVLVIIQLEKKHKNMWKAFNNIDELFLRVICNYFEYIFAHEAYNKKLTKYKHRDENIVDVFTRLMTANSQCNLIRLVKEILPTYHGFENANLLFYEPLNNKLYGLMDSDKEEYANAHYLVSDVGISGDIVKDHEIKTLNTTTIAKFNGEVDSVEGVKTLKTILYAPLFQDYPTNKHLIAILQLVNKTNNCIVKHKDIDFFKQMSGFYGLLILRVIEKQTILNMVLKLKDSSKSIGGILNSKWKNLDEYNMFKTSRLLEELSNFFMKFDKH